jgi:5'-methylthioadenosine nucleosidase
VSTGNSLDYTVECMHIMNANEAAVKEMEAAAVAYVCRLWGTPMFAIKAVTDIVDGERPAQEEFLENLATSAAALHDAVQRCLIYMQGKTLGDL